MTWLTRFALHRLCALPEWEGYVFIGGMQVPGEAVLALGKRSHFRTSESTSRSVEAFQSWLDATNSWTCGILSYDLLHAFEHVPALEENPGMQVPAITWWQPVVRIRLRAHGAEVEENASALSDATLLTLLEEDVPAPESELPIRLEPRISSEAYRGSVDALLAHIRRGDIYEVNYCQEFFAEAAPRSPLNTWLGLVARTEAPHACYAQNDALHLLCASPERFIQRHGDRVISQPIKGTIRRGATTEEDEALKEHLRNDPKERSENVMIVDLVRNDLSRLATRGSVEVEELFGIHTFRTVHHMISTIAAQVTSDTRFTDILRACFPMGSMTGAPKVRAMELIAAHEAFRRGWYSGSAGFIAANGDVEMNVIIRSITCDTSLPYSSCAVGSAITAQCDPGREYDETLLKARAVREVLAGHAHG